MGKRGTSGKIHFSLLSSLAFAVAIAIAGKSGCLIRTKMFCRKLCLLQSQMNSWNLVSNLSSLHMSLSGGQTLVLYGGALQEGSIYSQYHWSLAITVNSCSSRTKGKKCPPVSRVMYVCAEGNCKRHRLITSVQRGSIQPMKATDREGIGVEVVHPLEGGLMMDGVQECQTPSKRLRAILSVPKWLKQIADIEFRSHC